MKTALKIIAVLIIAIAASAVSIFLYWDRDQEIDFSKIMPPTIEHCGIKLGSSNVDYIALKKWFEANNKEWENTLVTFVPNDTYRSPNISVDILDTLVVVNYEKAPGEWNQVFKEKHPGLPMRCVSENKAIQTNPN